MSKTCIICLNKKKDVDFNDEHIIPQSLGNKKLKIYHVCTECNSLLGAKIDHELTNNIFAEIYRFYYKIEGQSGKIPNPFSKGGRTKNDKAIFIDDDLKPHYFPITCLINNESNSTLHVEAENFDKAITILNKRLLRMKRSLLSEGEVNELRQASIMISENPEVQYEYNMKLDKLNLSLIKIAYEFAYFNFGADYLKDAFAEVLRQYLFNFIYHDKYDENCETYIRLMPQEISEKIDTVYPQLNNESGFHMIFCCNLQNVCVVNIIIDKLYRFQIVADTQPRSETSNKTYIQLFPSGKSWIIDSNGNEI